MSTPMTARWSFLPWTAQGLWQASRLCPPGLSLFTVGMMARPSTAHSRTFAYNAPDVSAKEARPHVQRLRLRYGVGTRTQLALLADRQG